MNDKNERVDARGRLTRARGVKGVNSSRRWPGAGGGVHPSWQRWQENFGDRAVQSLHDCGFADFAICGFCDSTRVFRTHDFTTRQLRF